MKPAIFAALLSASALTGCISVLPEPFVPLALIALPADRATAPTTPLQADVAVYAPESPRSFAGADIAVRQEQELVFLNDVRWADNAPSVLQGAVVNALTKAGGPGRAASAGLGADVDYDVRWRIVDLSVGRDTAPVRVEAQVSLVDATNRRMVAQQTFSAEGNPTDRAPRARAAALALVAQQVADEIAAFVTANVVAKPR